MKKKVINVDNLPKYKYGNSERIDWSNSIGSKVIFKHEDIVGEVEILECLEGTKKIKILYKEKEFIIGRADFLKCNLGKILGINTKDFKIEIGATFKDDKRDITIIDREYRDRSDSENGKFKYYKYKCNVDDCGYEGWTTESHILTMNGGCSCCRGIVVDEHINSIWKTDPWMMELGVSINDAKKHTKRSSKKILVKCPLCGNEKYIKPNQIYSYKTISCTCGDGVSYPEKFMFSILKQLNLEFETQLTKSTFEWCENYRYDFYIPKYDMIIETHGEQHYKEASKFRKSLKETQENDNLKKELAEKNGIKNYIVINCEKANKDWIANNIVNSKLKELFDLDDLNWDVAELYAIKNNLCKEISSYWNNREEWESTNTIASNNKWGIKSPITILKYVKRGAKLGWCEYSVEEEFLRSARKRFNPQRKPIRVFKDGILVGEFKSMNQLQQKSEGLYGVKLHINEVARCEKESKEYKGYTFEFINKNK